MARIVRIYPRNIGGYGAMGGVNAYQTSILKAQAKTALAMQALNFEKQLGSFKLGALGKIYDEKLENADLKAQIKYRPQFQAPMYGGYPGYPVGGYPQPLYGAAGIGNSMMSSFGLGGFGGFGMF